MGFVKCPSLAFVIGGKKPLFNWRKSMASFARDGPQQLLFMHRLISIEYWHKLQWFSIHDHGTKHSVESIPFSCFFFCCFCSSIFSFSVPSNCRFSNGLTSSSTYRASTLFPLFYSNYSFYLFILSNYLNYLLFYLFYLFYLFIYLFVLSNYLNFLFIRFILIIKLIYSTEIFFFVLFISKKGKWLSYTWSKYLTWGWGVGATIKSILANICQLPYIIYKKILIINVFNVVR